jgi:hypothetical protein
VAPGLRAAVAVGVVADHLHQAQPALVRLDDLLDQPACAGLTVVGGGLRQCCGLAVGPASAASSATVLAAGNIVLSKGKIRPNTVRLRHSRRQHHER